MEQLRNILSHPKLHAILEQYNRNKEEKESVAYNIFNLSSYNNQLENFHSDIIASLLDPAGMHMQKDVFLKAFIHYLNTAYKASIPLKKFKECRVAREEGRIDISILDEESKSAIIIENKMNDADDMEDQLLRYYELLKDDYSVYCIVYLTLDGVKQAPTHTEELKSLICTVGAFTNEKSDLVHGWLIPCKTMAQYEDNSSLIHQYIKLIKYLAQKRMDTNTYKDFYDFVNKENGLAIAEQLRELLDGLPKYRRDNLSKTITDYTPFKKANIKWQDYVLLYQNHFDSVYFYDIGVYFFSDGSAKVYFWNPNENNDQERQALDAKLKMIGLLNQSKTDYDSGYNSRVFVFNPDVYEGSMEKVDLAVTEFVQDFLKRLRKLEANKI